MDKCCFEIDGIEKIQNVYQLEEILQILGNEAWELPALETNQQFLTELAQKICNFGKVIVLRIDDKDIGFAAFYCNDYVNRVGFLSLFAVDNNYRGSGYAHNIFHAVIKKMRESGMDCLKLEVRKDNQRAISFYKKEGLQIIQEDEKTIYMTKNISCDEEF